MLGRPRSHPAGEARHPNCGRHAIARRGGQHRGVVLPPKIGAIPMDEYREVVPTIRLTELAHGGGCGLMISCATNDAQAMLARIRDAVAAERPLSALWRRATEDRSGVGLISDRGTTYG